MIIRCQPFLNIVEEWKEFDRFFEIWTPRSLGLCINVPIVKESFAVMVAVQNADVE